MPIYVTLLKNTAQGAKEIKDFGAAVEEAAGWIATDGGKVLGAYALPDSLRVWIFGDPEKIVVTLKSIGAEDFFAVRSDQSGGLFDRGSKIFDFFCTLSGVLKKCYIDRHSGSPFGV